jgi:hypothetical protein
MNVDLGIDLSGNILHQSGIFVKIRAQWSLASRALVRSTNHAFINGEDSNESRHWCADKAPSSFEKRF